MGVRDDLRKELTDAMRSKDRAVIAPLRSALAAIDNAESVDSADVPVVDARIAGSAGGLGAAETARRHLTEQQQCAIVTREIAELSSHVERLTRLCRRDEADAARRALEILNRVVRSPGSD